MVDTPVHIPPLVWFGSVFFNRTVQHVSIDKMVVIKCISAHDGFTTITAPRVYRLVRPRMRTAAVHAGVTLL